MSIAAVPQPAVSEDSQAPHLEWQLAMLRQLAQDGMALSEAINNQAAAGEITGDKAAVAHGRVARAVRLTLALHTRLVADANAPAPQPDKAREERRDQVKRIVHRVIAESTEDFEDASWRMAEARERLEYDDIYGDMLARPVSEIIAQVCSDLGVHPDWAWLSTEAWAREEIATGAPGAPLVDDDEDLDDEDDAFIDEEADEEDGADDP